MVPRETENNAYPKFWSDQQRVLWYVVVFSGVVDMKFHIQLNASISVGNRRQTRVFLVEN